jgi:WD40-like Beta Propeller Repeat
MRLPTFGLLLAALVVSVPAAQAQPFAAAAPMLAADLQGLPFSGDPSQLAWSPDSTTVCLQTLEGDRPPLKTRYYLIRLGEHAFHGIDVAPDWAPKYWDWKSARTPPGHPELVIEVDTQSKAGKIPTQSLQEKSKNGLMDNAVAAQNEAGGSVVRTLTLKGEAIGRYVNQPLVPGMTFGWSPEALHAVAYAKPGGELALMDLQGGKIAVDTTKGVSLPAWSPDGSMIVYVQKQGRHHYALMQVAVTHP